MKKVVSGGPVRAVAVSQADAGLPDTTFFISGPPNRRAARFRAAITPVTWLEPLPKQMAR
jgi:hypothetical protein